MDALAYAQGISFRVWGPDSTLGPSRRLSAWLGRAGLSLEVLNTRLPERARATRALLSPLLEIPRMSTFAIGAVINHAVRTMAPGTCFVNVGVWHGFTLLAGMAGNEDRRCVGVDNFSEFGGPEAAFRARFDARRSRTHDFHALDQREYFARRHGDEPIGFYVYDGDHSYEQQRLGLVAADPFLAPGALILVDDTNRHEPRHATLDFVQANADRYDIVFDQRTAGEAHATFWNGVMLVRRTPGRASIRKEAGSSDPATRTL